MGAEVATLDLRAMRLASGAADRRIVTVPAVDLLSGGSEYVTDPAAPEVDVEISRSTSGVHMRLRADVVLVGPCWRCVAEARVPIRIDVGEFQSDGREGGSFDEDLDSAYIDEGRVALALWVRDSIAEALPAVILCRDDCAGLCPVCGGDRNDVVCDCTVESTDPRWDALREISERLGSEE